MYDSNKWSNHRVRGNWVYNSVDPVVIQVARHALNISTNHFPRTYHLFESSLIYDSNE